MSTTIGRGLSFDRMQDVSSVHHPSSLSRLVSAKLDEVAALAPADFSKGLSDEDVSEARFERQINPRAYDLSNQWSGRGSGLEYGRMIRVSGPAERQSGSDDASLSELKEQLQYAFQDQDLEVIGWLKDRKTGELFAAYHVPELTFQMQLAAMEKRGLVEPRFSAPSFAPTTLTRARPVAAVHQAPSRASPMLLRVGDGPGRAAPGSYEVKWNGKILESLPPRIDLEVARAPGAEGDLGGELEWTPPASLAPDLGVYSIFVNGTKVTTGRRE